jgi:hypothetical protein
MLIVTEKDLEPNLKRYLEHIEDRFLFHDNYGLKHPLALYNTSFGKIESDLQDFFDTYKNLKVQDFLTKTEGNPDSKIFKSLKKWWNFILKSKGDPDSKIRELLKKYRLFLYSLREHLDDCFHVVKSFVPPQATFQDERNQYSWLRKNVIDQYVINFLNNVEDYKKFLDGIVNELKHNNAVINYFVFYDEDTKDFSLGYYVANVVNERYEPVAKVHEKFNGQETAFSFARDTRFNMCNVFRISEEIIKLIHDLRISPTFPAKEYIKNEKRHLLYQDISGLPRCFFPDEYKKAIPSVVLNENGTLKLELPSKLSLKPLNYRRALQSMSGDGKTRSFALLYFSGK